jgi:hypothetical protein
MGCYPTQGTIAFESSARRTPDICRSTGIILVDGFRPHCGHWLIVSVTAAYSPKRTLAAANRRKVVATSSRDFAQRAHQVGLSSITCYPETIAFR